MSEEPTVEQIRADLEAGEGPHAVRLARKLAEGCDIDTMLDLSAAFAEHATFGPLVDIWRRRIAKRPLHEREHAAFANALNGLANEHLTERREKEAMELLAEAIDIAPRLDYIRRNIASMLVHKGDFDAALTELDILLTKSPHDPQANLLLGVARYQSGDPALALEPLTQSFHAGFPDAGLWLLKAQCVEGHDSDVERTLERLIADHPERAATMIELELNEPGSPLQKLRDHPAVQKLLT
ncbi:MAG: tetratricopeptide repeat protein [Planctomycetes bacterium]|nr:tetratricopeptide repeat protein [Planctomycetota bacterium]